jgi:hypothetical protein
MILQDGAQTLTEVVTKSNHLQKYYTIDEGDHFNLQRQSQLSAF